MSGSFRVAAPNAAGDRTGFIGFLDAEMSWVMEDNLRMRRAARLMGGRPCRTYRVYTRTIA